MADLKTTEIDPDTFAWGDLCDIYGNPYKIGDQFRMKDWTGGMMPNFDRELGPATLLYLKPPPDENTETQYVTGRPKDPHEIDGWTHYKLRELTEHLGTRLSPTEVMGMIDAAEDAYGEPLSWAQAAKDLVHESSDDDGNWTDAQHGQEVE